MLLLLLPLLYAQVSLLMAGSDDGVVRVWSNAHAEGQQVLIRLHRIALHCIALHCIALHCNRIAPHFIIIDALGLLFRRPTEARHSVGMPPRSDAVATTASATSSATSAAQQQQ